MCSSRNLSSGDDDNTLHSLPLHGVLPGNSSLDDSGDLTLPAQSSSFMLSESDNTWPMICSDSDSTWPMVCSDADPVLAAPSNQSTRRS